MGPAGLQAGSPVPRALAQALRRHVELCDCGQRSVTRLGSWNKNSYDFLEGWLLKTQGLASRAQQSTPVTVIYFVLPVVA